MYRPALKHEIMLVTRCGDSKLDDYLNFIERAVQLGVTSVQLREKNRTDGFVLQIGQALQSVLSRYHVPLIVNDRVDLALALNAEGVHLGQQDGDPRKARAFLGKNKKIGLTINSLEDLMIANEMDIDYIGVGAIFETQSKKNVQKIWGISALAEVCERSLHPVIAIGGLNLENAASIMRSGVRGLASISCLHEAEDLASCLKRLQHIVQTGGC